MKLQTERIEGHRARLTIEIEPEKMHAAKQRASRKLSREVRIRGFRKGKAPYRVVAQHVGEVAILQEALDALGDELYKRALEESGIVAWGPGVFEDFEAEPAPAMVFTVPLQPEVDLHDYKNLRLDYEAPAVSDDDVEAHLHELREAAMEVLDDDIRFAELGHRVHFRVDSEFLDGEPPDEVEDLDDAPEDGEDSQPVIPRKGDALITDDRAVAILDPNEDPFVHGFVEYLVGAERGSDIEFDLTIPHDHPDETARGRQVRFNVGINRIEKISRPQLDDDFARQVSENRGDEAMDLASLHAATRAELERDAQDEAKRQYCAEMAEAIAEGATIRYAHDMVEDQMDEMARDFEADLIGRRIKPEDYYRFTNSSKDELRESYRERAEETLRLSLVIGEVVRAHNIEISEEDLRLRQEFAISSFGGSPRIRAYFESDTARQNLRNDMAFGIANEHLWAIGRGLNAEEAVEALRARMKADVQLASERARRRQALAERESAESPPQADIQENAS